MTNNCSKFWNRIFENRFHVGPDEYYFGSELSYDGSMFHLVWLYYSEYNTDTVKWGIKCKVAEICKMKLCTA